MRKVYLIAGVAVLTILVITSLLVMRRSTSVMEPEKKASALYKAADNLLNAGKLDEAEFEFKKLISAYPDSNKVPLALYSLCGIRQKQGQIVGAKEACEELISKYSGSELVKDVQKKLGQLNIEILFSPAATKDSVSYDVAPGDSLFSIARKFNTTAELLKRSNNLKTDQLRANMRLKVYKGKFSVVVNKAQNTLTLKSNGEVFKVYNVSTGKDTSITPSGDFKVVNKLVNPVWYTANEAIPAGDPRNILGTRWLGLDKSGYGIHGTTQPQSIGKSVTAGCVRMYNREVEELFDILPVGTEVTIVE